MIEIDFDNETINSWHSDLTDPETDEQIYISVNRHKIPTPWTIGNVCKGLGVLLKVTKDRLSMLDRT